MGIKLSFSELLEKINSLSELEKNVVRIVLKVPKKEPVGSNEQVNISEPSFRTIETPVYDPSWNYKRYPGSTRD